jgi:hypothetical protein
MLLLVQCRGHLLIESGVAAATAAPPH